MNLGIDFEVTNRCNASCDFCPRDATPHQGLMTPEVFDKSLERAHEYRAIMHEHFEMEDRLTVRLCGLGEPLLNKNLPEFVRRCRAEDLHTTVSTNGALLDQRRSDALLEAGLEDVLINIADLDQPYEDVYNLPFERTRDNILRFAEQAGDDCDVYIVLVDYKRDGEHVQAMKDYWKSHGIKRFFEYDVINRGGALFVDQMQYHDYPESGVARDLLTADGGEANCVIPFIYPFIGYDGIYYLCCSDWKKEAPMGSVFDRSLFDVVADKYGFVNGREPVCAYCNHDPRNRLTDELRALNRGEVAQGDVDEMVTAMRSEAQAVVTFNDKVGAMFPPKDRPAGRRSIPVTAN